MKAIHRSKPLIEPGWTVDEVAQFLGTSVDQIYQLIHQGQLPHRKLGRKLLFRPREIEAFYSQLPGLSVQQALQRQQDLTNGTGVSAGVGDLDRQMLTQLDSGDS